MLDQVQHCKSGFIHFRSRCTRRDISASLSLIRRGCTVNQSKLPHCSGSSASTRRRLLALGAADGTALAAFRAFFEPRAAAAVAAAPLTGTAPVGAPRAGPDAFSCGFSFLAAAVAMRSAERRLRSRPFAASASFLALNSASAFL